MNENCEAKPYSCEICGFTFASNSHLQTHMRTYTREKPFACDTCGSAFSTNSSLKRHKITPWGEAL